MAILDKFPRFGVTTPEDVSSSLVAADGPKDVRNEEDFLDLFADFLIAEASVSSISRLY